MSITDFTEAMTILGLAYGKEFSQEQVGVWFGFFYDNSIDEFTVAVQRLIKKSKYMPSIAEISDEIVKIKNPTLQLNAEEEFEKVREAIHKYGIYRQKELLASLNPYTAEIADQIGLHRMCMSQNIVWEKKEFIAEFNSQKSRYEEITKYNQNLLTETEKKNKARLDDMTKRVTKMIGG